MLTEKAKMVNSSHSAQQPQLTVGIGIDVGQARRHEPNQDSVGVYDEYCEDAAWLAAKGRLFVLADGMGGALGGKEASKIAVQLVIDCYYEDLDLEILPSLARAIQAANKRIRDQGQTAPGLRGLGTTLVAAVIRGRELVVANVGDSRAYLLRQGELRQLSLDHTSVQEQVRDGLLTPEEAAVHPRRSVLSRNLGSRRQAQPDFTSETLADGDALLLCSDGLWGPLGHEELGALLQQAHGASAAAQLVERANWRGGPDNISAIVIHVGWAETPGLARRLQAALRSLGARLLPRTQRLSSPHHCVPPHQPPHVLEAVAEPPLIPPPLPLDQPETVSEHS
jgi:serine/threonine protein phosphatase PrpC